MNRKDNQPMNQHDNNNNNMKYHFQPNRNLPGETKRPWIEMIITTNYQFLEARISNNVSQICKSVI